MFHYFDMENCSNDPQLIGDTNKLIICCGCNRENILKQCLKSQIKFPVYTAYLRNLALKILQDKHKYSCLGDCDRFHCFHRGCFGNDS